MGHRLDIASGKNEFDRRLGNSGFKSSSTTRASTSPRQLQAFWLPDIFRNTNGPAAFHPQWTFSRPRPMRCGWRFPF